MHTASAFAALVALGATLAACSSSDDNTGSGGSPATMEGSGGSGGGSGGAGGQVGGSGGSAGTGGEVCPLVAPSCPAECGAIDGQSIDATRGCYDRRVRLGCLPPDTVQTDDMSCIKEVVSGNLFQLSSGTHAELLADTDDYESCSESEMTTAVDADQCVGVGIAGECPNSRDVCPEGCVAFTGRLFDSDNTCLEQPIQLGCFPESGTVSRNGSCIRDEETGEVYLLESASYSNQLLLETRYRACALNDTMGTGEAGDCP